MQKVKQFSDKRERIFQTELVRRRHSSTPGEDEWVDLYELLQVPPETPARDLDEAIIGRGADIVYFTFSRAGKPPEILKLEKYLHDMRPILLDAPVRRRYDQQLQLHREKNAAAMRYQDFKSTLDLREHAGSCLSTLVFLLASPLLLWAFEKIV